MSRRALSVAEIAAQTLRLAVVSYAFGQGPECAAYAAGGADSPVQDLAVPTNTAVEQANLLGAGSENATFIALANRALQNGRPVLSPSVILPSTLFGRGRANHRVLVFRPLFDSTLSLQQKISRLEQHFRELDQTALAQVQALARSKKAKQVAEEKKRARKARRSCHPPSDHIRGKSPSPPPRAASYKPPGEDAKNAPKRKRGAAASGKKAPSKKGSKRVKRKA